MKIVFVGLNPDWNTWNPNDALENTTEAMDLADNWLGVAKVGPPFYNLLLFSIPQFEPGATCSHSQSARPRVKCKCGAQYGRCKLATGGPNTAQTVIWRFIANKRTSV